MSDNNDCVASNLTSAMEAKLAEVQAILELPNKAQYKYWVLHTWRTKKENRQDQLIVAAAPESQDHSNEAAFSDIIIKTGTKEFKCHKIIMFNSGSDYFKTLLKSDSAFAESKQEAIELKGDNSEAVEIMLRWMYGDRTSEHWTSALDVHVAVCVTAQKYLLPGLQQEALAALNKQLSLVDEFEENSDKIERVLEAVKHLQDT